MPHHREGLVDSLHRSLCVTGVLGMPSAPAIDHSIVFHDDFHRPDLRTFQGWGSPWVSIPGPVADADLRDGVHQIINNTGSAGFGWSYYNAEVDLAGLQPLGDCELRGSFKLDQPLGYERYMIFSLNATSQNVHNWWAKNGYNVFIEWDGSGHDEAEDPANPFGVGGYAFANWSDSDASGHNLGSYDDSKLWLRTVPYRASLTHFRFQRIGHDLRWKAWDDTMAEPDWDITAKIPAGTPFTGVPRIGTTEGGGGTIRSATFYEIELRDLS